MLRVPPLTFLKGSRKRQAGFTLIEVVVACTILASLTVMVMQNIQTGLKTKEKVHQEIEDMSAVRDGLRIIERDINLAYHYRDIEMEFLAQIKCRTPQTSPTPGPGQIGYVPPGSAAPSPSPSPSPATATAPNQACLNQFLISAKTDPKYQYRLDPTTQFVGKNDSLDFVTMNVGRVSDTQKIADFAKVGYSLKSCHDLNGNSTGKCVIRRFSPKAEGDVTKGGEESILIPNVTELKFRYIGKGKQDWVTDWSSLAQDGGTQNNFPQAVEVSLTTETEKTVGRNSKTRKISMQLVAAVRFPNNPPDPTVDPNTGQPVNPYSQAPVQQGYNPATGGAPQGGAFGR